MYPSIESAGRLLPVCSEGEGLDATLCFESAGTGPPFFISQGACVFFIFDRYKAASFPRRIQRETEDSVFGSGNEMCREMQYPSSWTDRRVDRSLTE